MENRARVSDIKKKFESLTVQNEIAKSCSPSVKRNKPVGKVNPIRQVVVNKCHIKRSNAFRSDKPVPSGVRHNSSSSNEGTNSEEAEVRLEDVLKTPLPKGPPPKKPPRTFQHIVSQVGSAGSEAKFGVRATLSAEPTCRRPPPPIRSKTESQIVLAKTLSPTKRPLNNQISPPSVSRIENLLCLNSLNCSDRISTGNIYDVPFEPKSVFFVDLSPNKNVYGLLKKPAGSDHIYSEPYSPWVNRKVRNINSAGAFLNTFINEQKKHNLPPSELKKNTPKLALEMKEPLHYMSSPIVEVGAGEESKRSNSRETKTRGQRLYTLKEGLHQSADGVAPKVNMNTSPSESDTDSIASSLEEALSAGKLEEVMAERKSYLRKVSSLRLPVGIHQMHLCDSILLIGLDSDPIRGKIPFVKFQYPKDGGVRESEIGGLCFPDCGNWPPRQYSHNSYSLVLTGEDGARRYAYCRRVQPEGAPICLPLAYVLLTSHNAFGFYHKVLVELEAEHGGTDVQFYSLVKHLYSLNLPPPGGYITLESGVEVHRNVDWRLEHNDLVRCLQLLGVDLFIRLLSSLLLERRLLLVASNISMVSDCREGLETALYPLSWQHTVVTAVPEHMLELCQSPTPYLMGILRTSPDSLPVSTIEEGMIVDIDSGCVVQCVGDEVEILPRKLRKALKRDLEEALAKESTQDNVATSRALLRLFSSLLGHYPNYICSSTHTFQREEFIKGVESKGVQAFLEWFTESAMFQAFIFDQLNQPKPSCMLEERCVEETKVKTINRAVKSFFGSRLVESRGGQ